MAEDFGTASILSLTSSGGDYTDSSGNTQSAGSNEFRWDHDSNGNFLGLLLDQSEKLVLSNLDIYTVPYTVKIICLIPSGDHRTVYSDDSGLRVFTYDGGIRWFQPAGHAGQVYADSTSYSAGDTATIYIVTTTEAASVTELAIGHDSPDDSMEWESHVKYIEFFPYEVTTGLGTAVSTWYVPTLHYDFRTERDLTYASKTSNVPTFTRSTKAWGFDSDGLLKEFASGTPRFVYDPSDGSALGYRAEGQRTNKNTNYNFNPDASLTNISASAGTLDRVDDGSNIPFDGEAVDANVFHLNNGTGGAVTVSIGGQVSNTNAHSFRIYCRFSGTAPTLQLTGGDGAVTCNDSYAETKSENVTPSATTDQLELSIPNGTEVWFLGNQLEEATFVSSPILTAGSAVTVNADDMSVALPSGFSNGVWTFIIEGVIYNPFNSDSQTVLSQGFSKRTIYYNAASLKTFDGSDGTTLGTVTTGVPFKAAVAADSNGCNVAFDGTTSTGTTTGYSLTALNIANNNLTSHVNIALSSITGYTVKFSESEL